MRYCWTVAVALLAFSSSSADLSPRVTTSLGDLQGSIRLTSKGQTYFAFEGVPFAKPPVGKHRFKQSVPVKPWSGVWNATRLPEACTQDIIPLDSIGSSNNVDIIGSEDCLYVNVYTPKLPSDSPDGKLLDVIVNIHGGGFRVGWGHMHGPEYVMDRETVYVNFNYRVGVLGFFSLEDETCPGNNGLKDQLLALKWVNKHIASFGGHANKITIVGASAGGASVHFHVLSSQSKGLFQKAISSSGSVFNPWVFTKTPRRNSLAIANFIGCSSNTSEQILDCLRERPAAQIASAINRLLYLGKAIPICPLGPVIEKPSSNDFISQQPIDIIKSKAFNDVPIVFSHANDEGSFLGLRMFDEEIPAELIENEWDKVAPHMLAFNENVDSAKLKDVAQRIRKHYLGEKKAADSLPEFIQMFSDRFFLNGVHEAAILHAENQVSPVYAYRFCYANPQIPYIVTANNIEGAAHASDIYYVLKFSNNSVEDWRTIPEGVLMSETMIDYYISFITQSPVPGWESVKSGLPNFKFLEIVSPIPSKNVFMTEKPKGEFWNKLNLQENWQTSVKPSSTVRSEL